MPSVRVYTLLLHIFVFFAILSTLLGTFLALPIFILAVGSLYYFHVDQVHQDTADEVLGSNLRGIQVIAHRGGSIDAPENTLEAFRQANKNGATAIELDVEFTKDGVAVLLHDSTVDRTTDGTGEIRNMTLKDAKRLNAGVNHSSSGKYPNATIPTLEEGVSECLDLGMKMYIDCKGGDASRTADAIVNIFQKYPDLYDNAVVCSFNPLVIIKVRRRDRSIITALTHRHQFLSRKDARSEEPRFMSRWKQCLAGPVDLLLEWSHNTWLWYLCGNSAFLAHNDQVSLNYVNAWRALGIAVIVWTVNDPEQKQLCAKTFKCSYITDTLMDTVSKEHMKLQ